MGDTKDMDSYLTSKRETSKEFGPSTSTIERMSALDPEFAIELQRMKEHWLGDANLILKEIMGAIQKKLKNPEVKLSEIAKALDIVSNKYNAYLGLPTSIEGHTHKVQVEVKDLTDEELDKRLGELHTHLNYKKLGEEQNVIEAVVVEEVDKAV